MLSILKVILIINIFVSGEVGSTSAVGRSSLTAGILTSNEMSGYEGCTKEEGDTVCQFIQKRIAGA
jgi:hypothetical protein